MLSLVRALPTLSGLPSCFNTCGGTSHRERGLAAEPVLVLFSLRPLPVRESRWKAEAQRIGRRLRRAALRSWRSHSTGQSQPSRKEVRCSWRSSAIACGWRFPYLLIRTSRLARPLGPPAPLILLFVRGDHRLLLRGQPRRQPSGKRQPPTARLRAALEAVLGREPVNPGSRPPRSVCKHQVHPGKEPAWM